MASPTVYDAVNRCYVHASAVANATGGTADAIARTALSAANAAIKKARITAGGTGQGPTVYDGARHCYVFAAAITNPTGGAAGTVDDELRTAVNQILAALRGAAIIAGGADGGPTVYDGISHSYAFSAYTTPSGQTDITDTPGRTQANALAAALKSAGLLAN